MTKGKYDLEDTNGGGTVTNGDKRTNGDTKPTQAEDYATENGDAGPEDKRRSKKKKEKKIRKVVGILDLFRYATKNDKILLVIGAIAAFLNGSCLNINILLFGEMANRFTKFQIESLDNSTATTFDIEDEVSKFGLYYLALGLVNMLVGGLMSYCWSVTSSKQIHRIRMAFFKALLRQDIAWYDCNDAGEMTTRLTEDLITIQGGIGDKAAFLIQTVAQFLVGIAVAFYYSWKLTLVVLAAIPALLLAATFKAQVLMMFTEKEQEAYAQAGGIAEEVIGSIRTVVSLCGEETEIERFNTNLKSAEKAGIRKGMTMGVGLGMFRFVDFATYSLTFWYGARLLNDGELEGGDLLLVFFSVLIGATGIGESGPRMEAIASARSAAWTIFQVIERVPPIDVFSDKGSTQEIVGDIEFKDVTFEYPLQPDLRILNGFNLSVRNGTTVALVGESGCGKSTTIKLIQQFYQHSGGSITIDGVPIQDYNLRHLRHQIGVVSQEPILFDLSVAENIRMGKQSATMEEVEQAARDANAHDFIVKMPEGYNTLVGEGGSQMSGGQKQRIAIARALVRNPKILLLDEATSALDTTSESVVQQALDRASEGRTTIVIAHRLSTVRRANVIVSVNKGRVEEAGSHEDLMEKRGIYFKLVMLQTFEEKEEELEEIAEEEEYLERQSSGLRKRGTSIKRSSGRFAEAAKKLGRKQSAFSIAAAEFSRSVSVLSQGSERDRIAAQELEAALADSIRNDNRKSLRKSKRKQIEIESRPKKKEEEEEEIVEPASFSRIMKLNSPEWPYLVVGCIFSGINGIFPIVVSFLVSQFLKIFGTNDKTKIKDDSEFLALLFLIFAICLGISNFLTQLLLGIAGERLTTRLRKSAFASILRQNIGFFDEPRNSTGALTARLAGDCSSVKGATSSRIATFVEMFVMLIGSIVWAMVYSWKLTLVILCFIPIILLAGLIKGRSEGSSDESEKEKISKAAAISADAVINIRTVATLGNELNFVQQYEDLLTPVLNKALRTAIIASIAFSVAASSIAFTSAAVFRYGGYLVKQGDIEFQDVFQVFLAVIFGSMFAGVVATLAPDYIKAKISAARVFLLIDRKSEIDYTLNEGIGMDGVDGNIHIKDIHFTYPTRPDMKVLHGFGIRIKAGQSCALVGGSGSGKSTNIGLLERFYDPTSGEIYLDNVDIKKLNLRFLRRTLGLVSQEPTLFKCSVRENITYGIDLQKTPISQEQIEAAAASANIHNFIMGLPQGYDSHVGGRDSRISGGQKQRIAIARALVRDPQILLLDEATSALDTESEQVVQEAIDKAMKNRTSIIIAHRLSTVQNADLIVVLQNGRVVETGTHSELMAVQGAYYLLHKSKE